MLARRLVWLPVLGIALCSPAPAAAHPVPFSYVDLRITSTAVDVTLVAHVVDVAHELNVDPPEQLLNPTVVAQHADAIAAILGRRLSLDADGQRLISGTWSTPEVLVSRQSLKWMFRYVLQRPPGSLTFTAALFPYDSTHQTFVNVYEGDALNAQVILDRSRTRFQHFTGTRSGVVAVVRKFVPLGTQHILIGPDHLLFLVGLLLLGGTVRRLVLVVTAFTLAHSVTLSLAVLNVVTPPARLIEPAIALSIVYVGADNLLARGGRDVRAWIALTFGLIHGFGFANVLREMGLPSRAVGWSLFSFNLGVEIGQLAVVVVVATAITALQSKSVVAGRRLAFAGSLVVIAAGTVWFVQRVFFPGGLS